MANSQSVALPTELEVYKVLNAYFLLAPRIWDLVADGNYEPVTHAYHEVVPGVKPWEYRKICIAACAERKLTAR